MVIDEQEMTIEEVFEFIRQVAETLDADSNLTWREKKEAMDGAVFALCAHVLADEAATETAEEWAAALGNWNRANDRMRAEDSFRHRDTIAQLRARAEENDLQWRRVEAELLRRSAPPPAPAPVPTPAPVAPAAPALAPAGSAPPPAPTPAPAPQPAANHAQDVPVQFASTDEWTDYVRNRFEAYRAAGHDVGWNRYHQSYVMNTPLERRSAEHAEWLVVRVILANAGRSRRFDPFAQLAGAVVNGHVELNDAIEQARAIGAELAQPQPAQTPAPAPAIPAAPPPAPVPVAVPVAPPAVVNAGPPLAGTVDQATYLQQCQMVAAISQDENVQDQGAYMAQIQHYARLAAQAIQRGDDPQAIHDEARAFFRREAGSAGNVINTEGGNNA